MREEIERVFTVKTKIERVRDPKSGQPLATPAIIEENCFLPSLIAQFLPFHEGAFRGLQAQIIKQDGGISRLCSQIGAVAKVMLQAEKNIKFIAETADKKMLKPPLKKFTGKKGTVEDGASNNKE